MEPSECNKLRIGEQARLLDRRIRHHRHSSLAHPGKEVKLDAATRQIVEQLIGLDAACAGYRGQLPHILDIEIAHAEVADLSRFLQRREGFQGISKRNAASPMQKVEIQAIGAEPL